MKSTIRILSIFLAMFLFLIKKELGIYGFLPNFLICSIVATVFHFTKSDGDEMEPSKSRSVKPADTAERQATAPPPLRTSRVERAPVLD